MATLGWGEGVRDRGLVARPGLAQAAWCQRVAPLGDRPHPQPSVETAEVYDPPRRATHPRVARAPGLAPTDLGGVDSAWDGLGLPRVWGRLRRRSARGVPMHERRVEGGVVPRRGLVAHRRGPREDRRRIAHPPAWGHARVAARHPRLAGGLVHRRPRVPRQGWRARVCPHAAGVGQVGEAAAASEMGGVVRGGAPSAPRRRGPPAAPTPPAARLAGAPSRRRGAAPGCRLACPAVLHAVAPVSPQALTTPPLAGCVGHNLGRHGGCSRHETGVASVHEAPVVAHRGQPPARLHACDANRGPVGLFPCIT